MSQFLKTQSLNYAINTRPTVLQHKACVVSQATPSYHWWEGGSGDYAYRELLPAVFDLKRNLTEKTSIVMTISPVVALMKDQTSSLTARGISAAYVTGAIKFNALVQNIKRVLRNMPTRALPYIIRKVYVPIITYCGH